MCRNVCFTADKANLDNYPFVYDIPVINYGTIVEIQSTRCNGITECWNDIDELECGFSTSDTILIGMLSIRNKLDHRVSISHVIKKKLSYA